MPQWYDDVIKWNHFPRNWPFVREIHRSPVNSPHKGQWRGALMFSLICACINDWVNNREAGTLRRHRAHYDVTVMIDFDIIRFDNSVTSVKRSNSLSTFCNNSGNIFYVDKCVNYYQRRGVLIKRCSKVLMAAFTEHYYESIRLCLFAPTHALEIMAI